MSHTIAAYFNQCLELERRLSTLTNSEKFEVSYILQGLYSVNAKQLHDDRVQLFAACNMFKKLVTPSLEVTNYMFKHSQEVNILDVWSADGEVASDEDDDSDYDDD